MTLKCVLLCVQITFDNRAHSGKITVEVENDAKIYECRGWNVEGTCEFYPEVICPFSRSNCSADCILFFATTESVDLVRSC